MPSLMIVGTTSHAGKSLLTAAICRILVRKGTSVTPFKGQNMALNAYVTKTGGEIGHAQAVQAWAAKTTPKIEMNPILLKPQGDMTSQVILNGYAVGTTSAAAYYEDYFSKGWDAITAALESLKNSYDWLVCEGAGSPAEINLKHRDLTNMRVAKYLKAPTLLVVDIDRGGSFAHVVGTLQLLDPDERALIKGVIINKFRGQKSLLDSGITWLENYTGIPVVGVIPWLKLQMPAEDSLDLLERRSSKPDAEIEIKVLRVPRIANFTDFDPLEAETTVSLKYISLDESLGTPDAVILPGTKTTIEDLAALFYSGMAQQLKEYFAKGGTIFGICGGFQMLGKEVTDPECLEGTIPYHVGLDLLPLSTEMTPEKIIRQREVMTTQAGIIVTGYEIHQGVSKYLEPCQTLFEDTTLGIVNSTKTVWGSYLHGLFENGIWRREWLNHLRVKKGLSPLVTDIPNYAQARETLLDSLADAVEANLDERFQALIRPNTLTPHPLTPSP